jgi:hypothetical protein
MMSSVSSKTMPSHLADIDNKTSFSSSAGKKRVAIVIANPSTSTTTGWPVGFWWSELTHPYYVLTENGYEIEVFSPNGGRCQADALSDPRDPTGYSSGDLITMGFIATPSCAALIEDASRPPISTSRISTRSSLPEARRRCSHSRPRRGSIAHSWSSTSEGKLRWLLCHGVAVLKRSTFEW